MKKLLRDNYTWISSMIIVFAFLIIFLIIQGIRPFGTKLFVSSDCLEQVYPFLCVLYDKLHSRENLSYFWNSGLGGNYLAAFFYYVSSPIYLFILFIDRSDILDFITISIIVKLAMMAGSMGFYLKKIKSDDSNRIIIIPLSCAYALSNFMLAYHYECMWLDSFVLFPIIMIGYDRLINQHKPVLYILSLAIAAYCNFYMIYIIGLFLVIWFLIDDHESIKSFIKDSLWFGLSSILAAGMSMLSILVSYLGVRTTHVQSEGNAGHLWYGNIFEVIRSQFIFSKLQPVGTSLNQSNIYSGTCIIICFCIYIFLKDIPLIKRIKRLGLVLFFLISMNESMLNFIWHSFHTPLHVPNRFGFLFVFILLVIASDVFENINESNIKIAVLGMALSVILPMTSYFFVDFDSDISSKYILIISLVFVLIYCVLIGIYSQQSKSKNIIYMVISILMVCELIVNAGFLMEKEKQYSEEVVKDIASFQQAVTSVEANEKTRDTFYRSGYIYDDLMNGSSIFGTNGIETFSSMFPMGTLRFAKLNGLLARSNGIKNFGYSEFIESLLAEKYIYAYKDKDCYFERQNYSKIYENDRVNVYENDKYLGLGFAVSGDVLEFQDYYADESFYNENMLMAEMLGLDENSFEVFNEVYPSININILGGNAEAVQAQYCTILNHIEDYKKRMIEMDIDIPQKGEYYLSLFLDKDNNILVYNNDSLVRNVSLIAHDDLLYLGQCEEGDKIRIIIQAVDDSYKSVSEETIAVRLASFDYDKFALFYNELYDNQMIIKNMKSDSIKAEITLDDNEILFTSIPYDKGWRAYIDGKEIETIKLFDAFLGAEISEGKHEIELRYVPQGFYAGLVITLLSCIIFIVGAFLLNKKEHSQITAQGNES